MTLKQRFSIVFAFLVTLSSAEWNTNDYMKREHSLVKPYQGIKQWILIDFYLLSAINTVIFLFKGTGFGINNWDFYGNTIVTSTHIRLTPNEQSKQGAIWNNVVSISVNCNFFYWNIIINNFILIFTYININAFPCFIMYLYWFLCSQ